ncbi:DUF485 domain-containing protein [Thermodesulfovibrio sp. 3462-1]|uniref:DUF485 domain-containing protein n=1 Tax=Thermodesulfovibrio obliviosus TaxID=3118332 RepID=A0AAU8H5E3_9BACT
MNEKILNSTEFKSLVRSKNAISLILTIAELVVYFGFVLLIAYSKEFLGQKIYGPVTVGIPIGIGVIVISWIFTGIYVAWSNKKYDQKVAEIKEKLGGE